MWVEFVLYICVAMFLSDVGVWQLVSERVPTSPTTEFLRYVRRWLAAERQGRLSNPEALVEETAESQGDTWNFKVS